MSACEKCWGDACLEAINTGKSQPECYADLLRKRIKYPCSAEEQAGQFWDMKKQKDRRI